ncbi:iron chaperone [Roseivirga sp. E12]|uniref:iron chaperone n=1 Tax=Roseivirga sp. E12 TaxID=2819237 RepID=UPI001ABC402D|nr:DUF1801 domain-containing protein [Roseivirga sp. E12]MBO3697415.1 DUF1801 domain-containing protein [Roseivirga sp. E12]
MLYDAETPKEYIDQLEDDWRKEKLLQLRTIIHEMAPSLSEGINYKMLSYADDRGAAFHLNAQKGYVSFYVGDAKKVDPTGELLTGINIGKGCIRFSKSVKLAETRIDEFIKIAAQKWAEGKDIDC